MRLFQWTKDGGEKSHVSGLYIVEIKPWFSVVLLRFTEGSREAYHSHAFNALTWVLKGAFIEKKLDQSFRRFVPSFTPKRTPRHLFHKVVSQGTTWALTFRGPWSKTWWEFLPETSEFVQMTHGRRVVSRKRVPIELVKYGPVGD